MMNKSIVSLIIATFILTVIFFSQLTNSTFDISKVTVLYLLALSITGLWLFSGQRIKRSLFDLPIISYLGISVVSTIFSIAPYTSLFGTYKRYDGLLALIAYLIIFYATITFIQKKHIESILNIIIGTATAVCIYGLLQSLGYDYARWTTDFGYGGRAFSTFGHPGVLACFIAMVVPIVLYKIYTYRWFCVYLIPLGLMMYVIFETKARAGLVAMGISLIFFFAVFCYRFWREYLMQTVIILIIITGVVMYQEAFDTQPVSKRFIADTHAIVGTKNIKTLGTNRLKVYETGLRIIRDFPITGLGIDCLPFVYKAYYREEAGVRFENQNRLHNDFLDQAVTRGIPGMLIWGWLLVCIIRYGWQNTKPDFQHIPTPFIAKIDREDTLLSLTLFASIIAYLVNNQFSFGHISTIATFWFILGLMVVARNRSEAPPIKISVIKIGVSMLFVIFAFFSLKFFVADMYYREYQICRLKEDDVGAYQMIGSALNSNPIEPVYINKYRLHFLEQLYRFQGKKK